MLQVRPIITRMRRRLNDMQAAAYSDYELIDVLNDAQRMFFIALAESGSGIPRRTAELTARGGRAPLPADYYSLIRVSRKAGPNSGPAPHVDGRDVVLPGGADGREGTAVLEYNCVPLPASRMEEEIDLPYAVLLDIVEIAAQIARGGTGEAMSMAVASAKRLGGKREYGKLPKRRWDG